MSENNDINNYILQNENTIKKLLIDESKSDNKKEKRKNNIDLKNNNKYDKDKEIDLKRQTNLILIKNSLLKIKNKKFENYIQNGNNNNKINEIKFLNKKKINDEEDTKKEILNDKKEDKEENIEDYIEIIDEEELKISDKDIDDYKDNDDDIIEEEEDESFSISSKNSNNSFVKEQSKIINIYKRRKNKPKIQKKIVFNYKKGNKRTILKRKKYYVNQLLQRWWYALPKWPPDNFDTSDKLRENNLRLVEEKNWKKEAELNSDNFKKCIELPGYKYVYITKDGKIYDFRPEKDKPSFNNLMKLDDIELHQYLVNALKKQLEELEKRNFINEKNLRINVKNQLKIAKINLANIKKEKIK